MQPLSIAVLSALTPKKWDRIFFDDRLEKINFEIETNLVAISTETFTARRSYQIAEEFRKRGVPVIIGGYHATFCPDEVLEFADAVCIGEAENIWGEILADAEQGNLSGKYQSEKLYDMKKYNVDRNIFDGKKYFKLALIEAGRGCNYSCNFCSITSFHGGNYKYRNVEDIVSEIKKLNEKYLFFIDDNMTGNFTYAKKLFEALIPLKINWVGQVTINIGSDEELLQLMKKSGCVGVLIGLESLNAKNLKSIKKKHNDISEYKNLLSKINKYNIAVYATFMFGLANDSISVVEETVKFVIDEKIFMVAFNHIIPFPGTPLYIEKDNSNKLLYEKWWLSPEYRFGQAPFIPDCINSETLNDWSHRSRRTFYSIFSILKRSVNFSSNSCNIQRICFYFGINFMLRREIAQKKGLPLGEQK